MDTKYKGEIKMENNMYNIINNETLMSVKLMLDNCAHFGLNNIPY